MSTKTSTATAQLQKLKAQHEKQYAKLMEVRRRRDAFNEETENLRAAHTVRPHTFPEEYEGGRNPLPKPGTDAKKIEDELKQRLAHNPIDGEFSVALGIKQAAEIAERNYRAFNVERLIEEATPLADNDELTGAWAVIAEHVDRYRRQLKDATDILIDLPMFEGKDMAHDGRIDTWADVAADALDRPVFRPRIADGAGWKVDELAKRLRSEES